MRRFIYFFAFIFGSILSGCSTHKQIIGPFKASYFRESSGELVASEIVEWPAINYPWSSFHGIDAQDFYAVWEGNINLGKDKQGIAASFNVSWSDVEFYVDGNLNSKWSNSDRKIPLLLDPGIHSIKIKYHNNWHTVGFNSSFTNYPNVNESQGKIAIHNRLNESTKVVYIGAYESGDSYNRIMLNIPNTEHSILLFLSSYDSANWVLSNPFHSKIAGVFVSSYGGASTVNNLDKDVPIYCLGSLSYQDADLSKIKEITGLVTNYTFSAYSMTSVTIPEI